MHAEDFSCSICLEIFIEPQIIQCGHTFCRLCIEDSLNLSSSCPICRAVAGKVIPNRQLESITLRWMEDQGRGQEYVRKRESNRNRISVRNRALVILWTSINSSSEKSICLNEIFQKQPLDLDLKNEINRQVLLQRNIGLKVREEESGNVRVSFLS